MLHIQCIYIIYICADNNLQWNPDPSNKGHCTIKSLTISVTPTDLYQYNYIIKLSFHNPKVSITKRFQWMYTPCRTDSAKVSAHLA